MPETEPVRSEVLDAQRELILQRDDNPGSNNHVLAMRNLTDLLAQTPGAVDAFRTVQKDSIT